MLTAPGHQDSRACSLLPWEPSGLVGVASQAREHRPHLPLTGCSLAPGCLHLSRARSGGQSL